MKTIKNKWFIAYLFGYALWIAFNSAHYSPLDDHCFLGIYEYANLWRGVDPSEFIQGRFNVLHGLDLYLLMHIADLFSIENPVPLFYAFIAVVFFVSLLLLVRIIEKITTRWWVFLLIAAILLNPAFTSIYFRLLYQERYVFISFLIFILFIFRIEAGEEIRYWKIITVVMFAVFIKEIPFLSFGMFGLTYLLYRYQQGMLGTYHKKLGMILIASSGFYLLLYMFIVFPQIIVRYGGNPMGYLENTARSLWIWFWTNPTLFIVFLPLVGYRVYRIWIKKSDRMTIYDCFGLAGSIYCGSFFILKMVNTHYLTSVYAWAIPTVLYFYLQKGYYRKPLFFLAGIALIAISITNIRLGIDDIRFQRHTNKNFTAVIATLDSLSTHRDTAVDGRINFFVRGGADKNIATISGFLGFLISKDTGFVRAVVLAMDDTSSLLGIKARFDLLSEEKCREGGGLDLSYKTNFSFMDSDTLCSTKSGDYLIITPYASPHFQDSIPVGAKLLRTWSAPRPIPSIGSENVSCKVFQRLQLFGKKYEEYRPLHAEYRLYKIE